jgi:DNA-binding transcriptional LysR family regulator
MQTSSSLRRHILSHLGITDELLFASIQLQDASTVRRATRAGLEIGLISKIDALEDIAAGKLVAPFGLDVMNTMKKERRPGPPFGAIHGKGAASSAASSALSPCSVRYGTWLIRPTMKARRGSRTRLRCPPILPGTTEPVAPQR